MRPSHERIKSILSYDPETGELRWTENAPRNRGRERNKDRSLMDKVQYVKTAAQTRDHTCHWPSCSVQVKPAMWGCQRHWFLLPKRLRSMIFATFRPGQEEDGNPSREYLRVARIVQNWIQENYGTKP